MGFTKDCALRRKSQLEIAMGRLALEIKQREDELSKLQSANAVNEQMLRDFATEEAIEKSKEETEETK